MYAKLDGQNIAIAPKSVTIHFNPPPEWWMDQNGYMEVIDTPKPNDGQYAFAWQAVDGKIVKVWEKVEAGDVAGG